MFDPGGSQQVWDIPTSPVLTLGRRQESGEDFQKEISNICLVFLVCLGKIGLEMKKNHPPLLMEAVFGSLHYKWRQSLVQLTFCLKHCFCLFQQLERIKA